MYLQDLTSVLDASDTTDAHCQNISGDAVIQDGTPQHKASQWIMYNDDMTVDANEEPRFTQRYVLATMYYALSGESWTNSTGMLSSASECRWYGVDCAPLTHVIQKIKWGNNTLAGSIPSEIGLLENVDYLDMADNRLSEEIPVEIFQGMSTLKYLDLSDNILSGSLSDKVKNLAEYLGKMDLHGNALRGELPGSALAQLTQLHTLQLYDNGFEGPIPRELGSLTNLRRLDLDDNKFTGMIPEELGQLTNMEIMWLNGNKDISGPIPENIWSMTKLQTLVLGDMALSGTISENIGNLKDLQYLQLKNNQLEGKIPESIGS